MRGMFQTPRGASAGRSGEVILYYYLAASLLPGLRDTTGSGVDVACLTVDAAVTQEGVNGLYVLGTDALPRHWDIIDTTALVKMVEVVFDSLAGQSPLLPWLRRLYNSLDIDYYFKRVLLDDLGGLFSVASLATRPPLARYGLIVLKEDWPRSRFWPFFMDLWHANSTRARLAEHLPHSLSTSLDSLVVAREKGLLEAGKRLDLALYHFLRVWRLALRHLRPFAPPKESRPLLLRTYASDANINQGGQERLKNIDFVLHGWELPREKVAFWVEPGVSSERKKALVERGYHLFGSRDVVMAFGVFVRHVLPVLLSYTRALPGLIRQCPWWYSHVASLVYNYLLWREVCHQLKPLAFLAHNDSSAVGIARNIILQQHGCTSVFYQHSCSNLTTRPDGSLALNVVHSYLVFDIIATWGRAHTNMFRAHPGRIRHFWDVGCLWSEYARLVQDDSKLRKDYVDRIENYARHKLADFQKIIGVFDNSSDRKSPDHIYYFLISNIELACKMPNVLFLYKPKYPVSEPEPGEPIPLITAFGSKGEALWKKICDMPNFVVLPTLFEAAAVIGLADLAINVCFSSTLVEAIGSGGRAIYYDPTNRFPDAFWRRIPGMVCVAEEELYDRVCYLLWDCDNKTYMDYLSSYCMGIEGHFDGRAVTRLRSRLLDVLDRRAVTGT